MKLSPLLFALLTAWLATGCAQHQHHFAATEDYLHWAKTNALQLLNSPEAWRRFPSRVHKPSYGLSREAVVYYVEFKNPRLITVVFPTDKPVGNYQGIVAVVFDRDFNRSHDGVADMYEGYVNYHTHRPWPTDSAARRNDPEANWHLRFGDGKSARAGP